MGRAGGRSRCSTTGNQLVRRSTQAVLQNADCLIQGTPPYRVHDRGTRQVWVRQDCETSFTGEILGWTIQACVMRSGPQDNSKPKQIRNIVTSFAAKEDEHMEDKRSHERRPNFFRTKGS